MMVLKLQWYMYSEFKTYRNTISYFWLMRKRYSCFFCVVHWIILVCLRMFLTSLPRKKPNAGLSDHSSLIDHSNDPCRCKGIGTWKIQLPQSPQAQGRAKAGWTQASSYFAPSCIPTRIEISSYIISRAALDTSPSSMSKGDPNLWAKVPISKLKIDPHNLVSFPFSTACTVRYQAATARPDWNSAHCCSQDTASSSSRCPAS